MLNITTQEVRGQEKLWVTIRVGEIEFQVSAYQKGNKTKLVVDGNKDEVLVLWRKRSEVRGLDMAPRVSEN